MTSIPDRRGYLDWLRGIGVLIMIEAHTLDSWTRIPDRTTPAYRWAIVIGGFGAPIFLFLAGMAIALAANSRKRRGLSDHEVARRAMRRAWQVFGFAFLFRLQSLLISGGGLRAFLKVDILNVMGISMLIAAMLWRWGRTSRGRVLLFMMVTALAAMLTPPIRSSPLLDALPDSIEAYLRPQAGRSTFTLFPWGGFLFGGVLAGIWLDESGRSRERRQVLQLSAAGVTLAAAGYASAYLPPLYERASYWTSSPTFFFVRLGIIAALIGVAYGWVWLAGGRRSRVEEFGLASLFVYWIHVEMVYGVLSTPLHRALTFPQALVAMLIFTLLLFGLVQGKNRIVASWRNGERLTKAGSLRAPATPGRAHSG